MSENILDNNIDEAEKNSTIDFLTASRIYDDYKRQAKPQWYYVDKQNISNPYVSIDDIQQKVEGGYSQSIREFIQMSGDPKTLSNRMMFANAYSQEFGIPFNVALENSDVIGSALTGMNFDNRTYGEALKNELKDHYITDNAFNLYSSLYMLTGNEKYEKKARDYRNKKLNSQIRWEDYGFLGNAFKSGVPILAQTADTILFGALGGAVAGLNGAKIGVAAANSAMAWNEVASSLWDLKEEAGADIRKPEYVASAICQVALYSMLGYAGDTLFNPAIKKLIGDSEAVGKIGSNLFSKAVKNETVSRFGALLYKGLTDYGKTIAGESVEEGIEEIITGLGNNIALSIDNNRNDKNYNLSSKEEIVKNSLGAIVETAKTMLVTAPILMIGGRGSEYIRAKNFFKNKGIFSDGTERANPFPSDLVKNKFDVEEEDIKDKVEKIKTGIDTINPIQTKADTLTNIQVADRNSALDYEVCKRLGIENIPTKLYYQTVALDEDLINIKKDVKRRTNGVFNEDVLLVKNIDKAKTRLENNGYTFIENGQVIDSSGKVFKLELKEDKSLNTEAVEIENRGIFTYDENKHINDIWNNEINGKVKNLTQKEYRTALESIKRSGNSINDLKIIFDNKDTNHYKIKESTIHLNENANIQTLLHECGHYVRRHMNNDIQEKFNKAYGDINKWTEKQEEKFANDFVEYQRTGISKHKDLQTFFDKIKNFLNILGQAFKGKVNLNENVKKVFDEMFNTNLGLNKETENNIDIVEQETIDEDFYRLNETYEQDRYMLENNILLFNDRLQELVEDNELAKRQLLDRRTIIDNIEEWKRVFTSSKPNGNFDIFYEALSNDEFFGKSKDTDLERQAKLFWQMIWLKHNGSKYNREDKFLNLIKSDRMLIKLVNELINKDFMVDDELLDVNKKSSKEELNKARDTIMEHSSYYAKIYEDMTITDPIIKDMIQQFEMKDRLDKALNKDERNVMYDVDTYDRIINGDIKNLINRIKEVSPNKYKEELKNSLKNGIKDLDNEIKKLEKTIWKLGKENARKEELILKLLQRIKDLKTQRFVEKMQQRILRKGKFNSAIMGVEIEPALMVASYMMNERIFEKMVNGELVLTKKGKELVNFETQQFKQGLALLNELYTVISGDSLLAFDNQSPYDLLMMNDTLDILRDYGKDSLELKRAKQRERVANAVKSVISRFGFVDDSEDLQDLLKKEKQFINQLPQKERNKVNKILSSAFTYTAHLNPLANVLDNNNSNGYFHKMFNQYKVLDQARVGAIFQRTNKIKNYMTTQNITYGDLTKSLINDNGEVIKDRDNNKITIGDAMTIYAYTLYNRIADTNKDKDIRYDNIRHIYNNLTDTTNGNGYDNFFITDILNRLDNKYKKFVDLIIDELSSDKNFERIDGVNREVFNQSMMKYTYYMPAYSSGFNGDNVFTLDQFGVLAPDKRMTRDINFNSRYKMKIDNLLNIYLKSVEAEEKFIAFSQWATDLQRVYGNNMLGSFISKQFGENYKKAIDSFLKDYIGGNKYNEVNGNPRWINKVLGNNMVSALMFSMPPVLRQVGAWGAIADNGFVKADVLGKAINIVLHKDKEAYDLMHELSPYRYEDSSYKSFAMSSIEIPRTTYQAYERAIKEKGFALMEYVDQKGRDLIWFANFYQSIANGKSLQESADIAIKAVEDTQNSFRTANLSQAQRNDDLFMKMVLAFSNQGFQYLNKLYEIPYYAKNKMYNKIVGTTIELMVNSAVMLGVSGFFFKAVANILADDEDKKNKEITIDVIRSLFSNIPFGDTAFDLFTGDYRGNTSLSPLSILDDFRKLLQNPNEKNTYKFISNMLGTTTGIAPKSVINRYIDSNFDNADIGETIGRTILGKSFIENYEDLEWEVSKYY